MNESEIIDYLKGNKTKGVAFAFMPEEAKHWCGFHSPDKIFKVFDGVWSDSCYVDYFTAKNIYCLSEDYEPEPKFEPHWEEFDIDCDGYFTEESSNDFKRVYYWWNWAEFLNHNYDKYNNFGGYVYKELPQKSWQTYPVVAYNEKEPPLFPTKIRFWRYAE